MLSYGHEIHRKRQIRVSRRSGNPHCKAFKGQSATASLQDELGSAMDLQSATSVCATRMVVLCYALLLLPLPENAQSMLR